MASVLRVLQAPRSERTDIALCALLVVLITVLRLAVSNPIEAVGFLYVIPISLLAAERGLRHGLLAAAGAILATGCWALAQDVPLGVVGYGARAVTFLGVGVFVGLMSQQRLKLEREPLCVLAIDLDRLKHINDTHGPLEGDRLLQRCAHAWNGALRQGDYLARLGGDEFLVLLPGSPTLIAEQVASRFLGAVPFNQTCSIGLATWDGAEPAYELVHRADQYKHAAKAAGGGRVEARPVAA